MISILVMKIGGKFRKRNTGLIYGLIDSSEDLLLSVKVITYIIILI